jgi:hypothetical protein
MSDEFLFICAECGRQFAPEPDAIVVSGFSRRCVSEVDETPASEECVSTEDLEGMSEYHLAELGLTTEARNALLRGEDFVETGAMCICIPCQDRLLEEQESSEHCEK